MLGSLSNLSARHRTHAEAVTPDHKDSPETAPTKGTDRRRRRSRQSGRASMPGQTGVYASTVEKLIENLQRLLTPEMQITCDTVVAAEGKEIMCHQCILASSCRYFEKVFATSEKPTRIEFKQKWLVVYQLIRIIYGWPVDSSLTLFDCLELLGEIRALELNCADTELIVEHIGATLNSDNCILAIGHEETAHHAGLLKRITDFVADEILGHIQSAPHRVELLRLGTEQMLSLIRAACMQCKKDGDVSSLAQFVKQWSKSPSMCDLLKESKSWNWNGKGDDNEDAIEWRILDIKRACDEKTVWSLQGEFFTWNLRLDASSDGRVRVVYETVDNIPGVSACLRRFPAATVSWRAFCSGSEVEREKPAFICFAEDVKLQWSTTFNLTIGRARPDDEIVFSAKLVEHPLVSLILYYFSSDMSRASNAEDILNRLPHIEYRCLSSYSIFHVN